MSKLFFEVFPTLKMNEELRMLLESVEVLKVATNSSREFIRVHLRSRHLIQKKEIYDLEKRIKDQMFARSPIRIEVQDQYELSEQYTPENLMELYWESFLLELNDRSVVERNMLQSGTYEFEEETVSYTHLTLPTT